MIMANNNENKILNVPHLRFPEFSGEWDSERLENLTVSIGDGLHSTPVYCEQGDYCFINGNNIIDGKVSINEKTLRVTKEEAYKYNAALLKVDTILMSINGTIGNVALYNGENIMLGKSACYINPSSRIVREYLFHILSSPRIQAYFQGEVTGTTIKNLSLRTIRGSKILLPSNEEQKKIARLFSLVDERIATQNKIIEKLESLIKGLNDSLYAQYGNDVLTSFSSLGFSYSGLSGKSAQDFGSGKPFITYLNVYSNNIINEKDFQYVAIKDDEKQNVVEYGDVLFTLSSETPEEVGIGSVYLGNENVYLNSFCFGIHIRNTKIAFPPYLSYYVSLTPFRKFIYPYAQGSTRFNLCKADFEKANIKLPSLENQKRIYSILSHIESKTETEKSLLDLYNSQKQHLLRQMFI
jgi:type IC hsdS subunit